MRNVLAVVTPHPRHEGVIEEAAGLLSGGRGRLTVLCLWTPAPCWAFVGHAGIPPVELVSDHAERSAAWLRAACASVPAQISLTLCCRKRPAWWSRKPIDPPSSCGYDCVVIDDSLRVRIALDAGGAEHPCSAPAADSGEVGDVFPGSPGAALDPIDPFDHLELLLPAALPAAPERRDPSGPVKARNARE